MNQRHQLFRLSRFFSLHSCVFLVAAMFSGSTDASTHNIPKKVTAIVGETVILPCNITLSDDLPTIEWSKDGLSPNIIFLYRDGCETFEMKHPDFRFRTNLLMTELKHGNLSLRISNLQPSDEGRYQCMVLQKKQRKVVSTLELVVDSIPEPKLSVVQSEDGVLTVQCELKHCWSSPPEIMFLDDQGKEMSAENPKTVPHTGECFNITRTVTTANSITCRVLHSEMKIRDTKIYIPEICKTSCPQDIGIAIAVTTLVCGLACVIAAFLYRKYPFCVAREKAAVSLPSLNQSVAHSATQSRCHMNQADRDADLLREIEKLKSTLKNKDSIIREKNDKLRELGSRQGLDQQQSRSPIGSRSPPDISNPVNSNPKPTASTSNNHPKSHNLTPRNKDPKPSRRGLPPGPLTERSTHGSCPSLSTIKAAAVPPASAEKHRGRSRSFSEPQPSWAKPLHRNTMSHNRFSPLEDLSEDLEPLISGGEER